MRIKAPAKLNLGLFLGPPRADGLHELCSLFEPLALADVLTVSVIEGRGVPAGEAAVVLDEVVCPGVEGENLAARALAALRAAGWQAPPLRVEIEKRIPVAAGLGGGSADAAALLRLARDGSEAALREGCGALPVYFTGKSPHPDLAAVAAALGADVPSQLSPALALVQGAGERVERLPDPAPHAVVLLPGGGGLSTAAVFAEADRQSLGRPAAELAGIAARLRDAAGAGASPLAYGELLVNDLEPAARALRPEIGESLEALRAAGTPLALLSGSGPTAVGFFATLAEARAAAVRLGRDDAIVCEAGRAP